MNYNKNKGKASFILSDVMGKIIFKEALYYKNEKINRTISLDHLTDGFYFLSLRVGDRMLSKKIIKQ